MQIANQHYDVLIIGAGLSGIGAAHHLQKKCPERTFAIIEMRKNIGGTWDLFRYPGIRSDSDMHTLGYEFRPWTAAKAIADGPAILKYIKDAAQAEGIEKKIAFQHKIIAADWSSLDKKWTVHIEQVATGQQIKTTCQFLFMCSGYYNYKNGYMPKFAGIDQFAGQVIHPQHWTEDIDYENKKVVVIGSGATAVTLVPEMAKKAAHVTMLQRSPTYMIALPSKDMLANGLRKILPNRLVYRLIRFKNVLFQQITYKLARRFPNAAKKGLQRLAKKQLPSDFKTDIHLNPTYKPWDQRACLIPDGDLFEAITNGSATIVTDHIETFTQKGLQLRSGQQLAADIIVSATGLKLEMLGGATISVNGEPIKTGDLYCYRGMMYSSVPNFANVFGYTNASWTLKSDLIANYVCRLLNHMKNTSTSVCTPHYKADPNIAEPFIDFNSGYVLRDIDKLPKQGAQMPWKVHQNYIRDMINMKFNKLEDGIMIFS